MRITVDLHLGTPLCSPHQCASYGDHVDFSGNHGLHCRRSNGHLPRHSALNDLVKRSLSSVEVPSIMEPPGLFRSDGRRVDGVSVIPWQAGHPLAWDVTCRDTFTPAYKSLPASGAGSVANTAEHRKIQLYQGLEPTHAFIPIATETSGDFGEKALAFFREIGKRY